MQGMQVSFSRLLAFTISMIYFLFCHNFKLNNVKECTCKFVNLYTNMVCYIFLLQMGTELFFNNKDEGSENLLQQFVRYGL